MHPKSLEYLLNTYDILKITPSKIPEGRRAKIMEEWDVLGIHSLAEFNKIFKKLCKQNREEGQRRPNKENSFFNPTLGMLVP